jgi:hypothetical protein
VHYEALDRCLQATFFEDFGCHPDPQSNYATTIAIAFQASIAHHGIMPKYLDPIPILVNFSLQ